MRQTRRVERADDEALRETLVSTEPVFNGRLIRVRRDAVSFADGATATREVVEHPGAVTVVALDAHGRVALVRQWRHPVGRALWELPAGTRDHDGEAVQDTARRELGEETGAVAASWRRLAEAPLAPGYSSEVMHFFLASDLAGGPTSADPDERLEVGWFTKEEVVRLVARGEVDVKTVAGLALAGWRLAVADA